MIAETASGRSSGGCPGGRLVELRRTRDGPGRDRERVDAGQPAESGPGYMSIPKSSSISGRTSTVSEVMATTRAAISSARS